MNLKNDKHGIFNHEARQIIVNENILIKILKIFLIVNSWTVLIFLDRN